MRRHAWLVVACIGGLTLVCFTAFAFSPGGFPFAARTAITAATLASDPNEPPDPLDPNDRTGIAGLVGYPDPNDPNQDPNDPCSVPPLGGVIVHAVQDGEIVGSAMTGEPNMPNEGYYWVARLQPGTYDLRVIPPGYAAKVITGINVSFGWPTVVNIFDLVPEGRIGGTVTDFVGAAIEPNRVQVSVECVDGFVLMVEPNTNGEYEIRNVPPGTYTVKAFSLEYSFSAQENVSVAAGQMVDGIDFSAAAAGSISGVVREADGITPLAGALVSVSPVLQGRDSAVAITDPNGCYYLRNVPPGGSYTVTAAAAAAGLDPNDANHLEPVVEVQSISVVNGQTTTGVDLIAPGGAISGQTTPAVAGAVVMARPVGGCSSIREVSTAADGSYRIARVAAGVYDLTIRASGYVAPTLTGVLVGTGETAGHNFALGTEGRVVGHVTDALGAPVAGAAVGAVDPNGPLAQNNVPPVITDPSGAYTVEHLADGNYVIFVNAEGYAGDSVWHIHVESGQVVSGPNFALSASGGGISGAVYAENGTTPLPGAIVMCVGEGLSVSTAMTDDLGSYELLPLKAGTYVVLASAVGYVPSQIADVVVTVGQTASGKDFVLAPAGQ